MMKGWKIFVHSVRQVLGNLRKALQLSALLYLVEVAVAFAVGINLFVPGQMGPAISPPPLLPVLAIVLVSLVCSLWIAVGWHRYVLLIEEPGQFVPAFRSDRILAYLGRSLLIGLIMVPVGIVLSLASGGVVTLLGPVFPAAAPVLAGLIVVIPLVAIGMRLSASLPAAALGEPHGIGAGWKATAGQSGTLIALAVLIAVAGVLVDLPGMLVMAVASPLGIVWLLATGWLKLMVGVSVLTTLYGHYIEGRAIL
jgi:hypothetical protein